MFPKGNIRTTDNNAKANHHVHCGILLLLRWRRGTGRAATDLVVFTCFVYDARLRDFFATSTGGFSVTSGSLLVTGKAESSD